MHMPAFYRAGLVAGASVMAFAGNAFAEDAVAAHKKVQDFLGTYCLDCHDKDTRKGNLELESLDPAQLDDLTVRTERQVETVEGLRIEAAAEAFG